MLKGIDPILNAEVLHALRAMGHGDDLDPVRHQLPGAVGGAADGARRGSCASTRRWRGWRRRCSRSIRSTASSTTPPARMEIVGEPASVPEVQREVQAEIDAAEGKAWPMIGIERYAFYERAKQAYAVIQTGERRFYGCIALRKGVIPPEA